MSFIVQSESQYAMQNFAIVDFDDKITNNIKTDNKQLSTKKSFYLFRTGY